MDSPLQRGLQKFVFFLKQFTSGNYLSADDGIFFCFTLAFADRSDQGVELATPAGTLLCEACEVIHFNAFFHITCVVFAKCEWTFTAFSALHVGLMISHL